MEAFLSSIYLSKSITIARWIAGILGTLLEPAQQKRKLLSLSIGRKHVGSIVLFMLFLFQAWVLQPLQREAASFVEFKVSSASGVEAALSWDGSKIVLAKMGRLFVIPAEGGKAQALGGLGFASSPSWSPDGQQVAFSDGPDQMLYESGMDGQARRLSSAPGDRSAYSRDGRSIAFVRQRELWILDRTSSAERRVAENIMEGTRPLWSPDGREIFYISGNPAIPLERSILALAAVQPDRPARKVADVNGVYQMAFSGDGSRVAVLRYQRDDSAAKSQRFAFQVWTTDLTFSGLTRATAMENISWNVFGLFPSGGFLVLSVSNNSLLRISDDGSSSQPISFEALVRMRRAKVALPKITLAKPGSRLPVKGLSSPRISPDGRKVAFSALGDIWTTELDNPANRPQRFSHPAHDMHPAWFPDSRRLAFVSDRGGDYDIWELDGASGETRRVTSLAGEERFPCISPDGSWIAFTFFDRGEGGSGVDRARVSIVRIDGSALRHIGQTLYMTNNDPIAGWMADGSAVLIPTIAGSIPGEGLRAIPLSDSKPFNLTDWPKRARRIAWPVSSRDRIAFESGEQLWIQDFSEGKLTGSPRLMEYGRGSWPSFSADGKRLFFLTPDGPALHDFSGATTRKIDLGIFYEVPRSRLLVLADARIGGLGGQRFDIRLQDSRIVKISPHKKPVRLSGAEIFDLAGRVVVTGLIDAHVHMGDISYMPRCFLAFGVTTVVDMGSEPLAQLARAEAFDSGNLPGPRVIYAGDMVSNGPYVGSVWRPIANEDEARRYLERQYALGARVLKLYAPLPSLVEPFVGLAQQRGLYITGELTFPRAAYGTHGAEHMQSQDDLMLLRAMGASMTPTLVTVDTFLGYAYTSRVESLRPLIERSDWWPPYAKAGILRRMEAKQTDESPYINPWISQAREAWGLGINLLAGTDTGGPEAGIALHWEMERLVDAGLRADEALAAASRRTAQAFGLGSELGEVKVGYRADLVVLEADPYENILNTQKIWMVLKDGKIVHKR
jgi:Tol biopolymer transport system component